MCGSGGGGEWVHLNGADRDCQGLAGWAISLLPWSNGLRKQSSCLVEPLFQGVKRFPSLDWQCSRTCSGWLHGHVCEVWELKTRMFNTSVG